MANPFYKYVIIAYDGAEPYFIMGLFDTKDEAEHDHLVAHKEHWDSIVMDIGPDANIKVHCVNTPEIWD